MRVLKKHKIKVFDAFNELCNTINQSTVLTTKQRELIILACATTAQSPFGVALHAKRAHEASASLEEIVEAIVCCLPLTGIAAVNQALEAAMGVLEG